MIGAGLGPLCGPYASTGTDPQTGDFKGIAKLVDLIHYYSFTQARSSVGERFLDTEEVGSSILPVPTIF
jgi:hypothetical protein